jgi:Asp/Glu/hydantoin racemase
MKKRIAFIHTSPAAIPPLADYYKKNAPEFEITNVLDDGILRCFAAQDEPAAEARLLALCRHAIDNDGTALALITCSAVKRPLVSRLASSAGIPVLKIDDPLARTALALGPKLGVIVTFAPSKAAAESLLREMAADERMTVDLTTVVIPEAYEALLAGRTVDHDRMLIQAIEPLRESCAAVVLSQVSMARVLPHFDDQSGAPVLSALPLSLQAVRDALAP